MVFFFQKMSFRYKANLFLQGKLGAGVHLLLVGIFMRLVGLLICSPTKKKMTFILGSSFVGSILAAFMTWQSFGTIFYTAIHTNAFETWLCIFIHIFLEHLQLFPKISIEDFFLIRYFNILRKHFVRPGLRKIRTFYFPNFQCVPSH